MTLLSVTDLRAYFHTRGGVVRAVDGISFSLAPGETLGVVGESGSGKSVTMLALLGLMPMPPGRIESGRALFEDIDLLHASPRALRGIRGRRISMIFQDPMTSLNPFMTIGAQIMEPLRVHDRVSRAEAQDRAVNVLEQVGIHDGAQRLNAYPHEFSGGMRQRVMIAMGLITNPRLLIADEPTTALDVTVQAQILERIAVLKAQHQMAVLLITHDLGVVAGNCARVAVMYAGHIVETAPTAALFARPRHPYTAALMAALPTSGDPDAPLYAIPGFPPDLIAPISGCPFAPRCAHAMEACRQHAPRLQEVAPGNETACLRAQMGEYG